MPQRIEYKYLIEEFKYLKIRETLGLFSVVDKNASSKDGYKVSSIYFDSPRFQCHSDWVGGQFERFKLRLRWYSGNPSLYKLEVKKKIGARIYKLVCQLSRHEANEILRGIIPKALEAQTPLANCIRQLIFSEGFRPRIRIDYDRIAFFYKYNSDIRFTIDSNLRYSRCCSLETTALFAPLFPSYLRVFEVKATIALPSWLKKVINSQGLFRDSISKYSNSIHGLKLNSTEVI